MFLIYQVARFIITLLTQMINLYFNEATQSPEISCQKVQKLKHPSPLYLLPSYLANRKSYLINDCPIYFKTWLKVKLNQFKLVWTMLKITCTAEIISGHLIPPISPDMTEILSPIGEKAETNLLNICVKILN